jgi:hypothetical protein
MASLYRHRVCAYNPHAIWNRIRHRSLILAAEMHEDEMPFNDRPATAKWSVLARCHARVTAVMDS